MKEKDFNIRTKVIHETFDDNRKIVSSVKAEELKINRDIHQGGDIFITSQGEFIDLEFQMVDFTADELVKYVEFAEELYEQYEKEVSIYILCPNDINVCVRECEIKSDASFKIKLACIQEDPCEIILKGIKAKLKADNMLDEDDLDALAMLRVMCKKEDRNYYMREYLKIINRIYH